MEETYENCTLVKSNEKYECKTHEEFDKLVKKGLRNTEESIWDIAQELTNIILRKDDIARKKITNGVEKGLIYTEKALTTSI